MHRRTVQAVRGVLTHARSMEIRVNQARKWSNGLMRFLLYPLFARYIRMPGRRFQGSLGVLDPLESEIARRSKELVTVMAEGIGERSIRTVENLNACADFIEATFEDLGYSVVSQHFEYRKIPMRNVIAELPGTESGGKVLVLGAHYDTVIGCPGADDNATGVAALLELARLLKGKRFKHTIRFVAFANEESNGDGPELMGSYHYARSCHEAGDDLVGMISLEMLGSYSDEEGSQKYPFPFNLFYPSKGNFIGFVGNIDSGDFVRSVVGTFRAAVDFPAEGVAAPDRFQDINRSDHWGFWQFGYPALMATDTSNFRYEHLHTAEDTTEQVDFERMSRVIHGMLQVTEKLAAG